MGQVCMSAVKIFKALGDLFYGNQHARTSVANFGVSGHVIDIACPNEVHPPWRSWHTYSYSQPIPSRCVNIL